LFSIPSIPALQPAEPLSTISSTGATSKKGQSHWISLETLTKNHFNSTITVASILTRITTTKDKVLYKQKKLVKCICLFLLLIQLLLVLSSGNLD